MLFNSVFLEAFVLGFIGSIHCAGMCGPFVHILNSKNASKWKVNLAYNLSRSLTYSLAGFILGGLGGKMNELFLPDIAIFTGGGILVLFSLSYLFSGRKNASVKPSFISVKIASLMNKQKNIYFLSFLMGFSAAIMPCGVLYGAYGLAVSSESALNGAFSMFLFSLGMYPALFTVGFASHYFLKKVSAGYIRIALGIFMLLMGLSIILWRVYLIQTGQCH